MGRSTARVLDDRDFVKEPEAAARRAWESTGRCIAPNGALMRAAASGIRGKSFAASDAALFARATHADPRSTAACVAVAVAVAALLEGESAQGAGDFHSIAAEAFAAAVAYLPTEQQLGPAPEPNWACSLCTLENPAKVERCAACGGPRPAAGSSAVNAGFGVSWTAREAASLAYCRATALEELRWALFRNDAELVASKALVLDESKTLGYVMTCLAAAFDALYEALRRRGSSSADVIFCDILHRMTMAGGDADTNAAVAGALVGCALGQDALPRAWLELTPHKDWLERHIAAVCRASGGAS
eukprot:TRINITY_DN51716_c0_g1_i1.p1 TRINITY_DN51716_c0_g1~~TRINITY_DN51716_c0_g1_i1.p1  ORF type:complete len:341 (-),score=66.80 TRINITY_DN51716_c0_g1_i1:251-1156(-)